MFAIHTAFLGPLVAFAATTQAAAPTPKPPEPLCRDYREYTEPLCDGGSVPRSRRGLVQRIGPRPAFNEQEWRSRPCSHDPPPAPG